MPQELPNPGTTAQANMEWVLRFLGVDVHQMTIPELAGVLDHVRRLARLAIADPERRFEKWVVVPDAKIYRATLGVHVRRATKLREDLVGYQTWLAGAIRELTTCGITIVHIRCPSIQHSGRFPRRCRLR